MKTTGQKLAAFLLTAFMAMSAMAVSLDNTAYAEIIPKQGAEKCPDGSIDFSPQGVSKCVSGEDLEKCPAGSDFEYTIKGTDLCKADAGGAAKATESQMEKDTWKKFTTLIIGLESMMSKALWPVLALTGDLMNNNILFGPGMEQKLYDIWVPVRNIVNIFFVIALIGLALYSVLGINSENGQYSIKAMLPKLIAGIIAVNFSFIAIKVMLDAVNVFSTSVFAIPTQVQGLDKAVMDNGEGSEMSKARKAFCEAVYLDGKQFKDKAQFDKGVESAALFRIRDKFGFGGISNAEKIKELGEKTLQGEEKEAFNTELGKLTTEIAWCTAQNNKLELTPAGLGFFQKYGSQNAALAMAINMGEIMFYNRISTSLIGSGTYESMAIKELFILLMYLIYGASFVALFIILLARLIVVWLGLAMSPVIALSIAVPMVKDKLGLGELTSQFVKHAIAPVMVAFPMTVGWIMLNALHSTSSEATAYGAKEMLIPGIPIPGLETLQGLLISLATAAVVWIGVFAAAKGTIAEKVTGFMKERLEKLGEFVATAPLKYTPWVPVQMQEKGPPEMYSPGALLYALEAKKSQMETANKEAFTAKHPEWLGREGPTGPEGLSISTTKEGFATIAAANGEKFKEKEYIKGFGEIKNNSELRLVFTDMVNKGTPAERILGEKLLKAQKDPEVLKDLTTDDLKALKAWGEKNKKAGAAAPDAAAADAAKLEQETTATTTLGYTPEESKEGKKGAAAAEKLIKVADKIREIGIEEKPGEMEDMAKEMKKIKKADGKELSNTEIMGIVEGKMAEIKVSDPDKAKKKREAMEAALVKISPPPVQSVPTPAPAEGTPTPPAEGTNPPAA